MEFVADNLFRHFSNPVATNRMIILVQSFPNNGMSMANLQMNKKEAIKAIGRVYRSQRSIKANS